MADGAVWPRSVRARTTVLATLVSAVALVVSAVGLLVTLDRSLHHAGDNLARDRVTDLGALARQGGLPGNLASVGGEGVAQVFTDSGRVLAASPNIAGAPPITGPATSTQPTMRVLHGARDDDETEEYRVWVARAPGRSGPVTVVAGETLESVGEASQTLRRDLLVGVPLLVLLVAAGTWLVVGRTLRPVEDIRAEVAAIGAADLARRVPVPATEDEVGRLALTMNEMLARLEDASRRQRDFVADASHELQSPVTALRTQLEVSLAHGEDDWPAAARRMLGDTDQMERLVRDLLFLARTSTTPLPRDRSLLDLDDVVLEEAARVRAWSDVRVDTSRVSAAPVRGDADELRRLVRNLLENAVRHATSVVRLALAVDGAAVLDVTDDGPGVAPEDRDRVFDRFFTADGARSRGTGSGLGLAIARSVAVRHGGSLDLVGDGPGAHFRLTLPVSGALTGAMTGPGG
jgi:signal transduction histidine kinase